MPSSTRVPIALPPRFEPDREIGRGGMAVVYRAHDNHLGRYVAIKVLSPDLSSSVGAERFQREIALMAKLVHPGIVALFDSGEADGQLYYVMPFVAGETLRARLLRERRLTPQDAASLGADVAEALAYAHGAGIVHRDVKPENVFTVSGRAVLADFGIARLVGAAAGGGRDLTTGGVVLGTLAYMSPEQGLGEPDLDGRSDLYSLGCMLYELLCGEPPFTAPTALAVLGKHLSEAPLPLAARGTTAPQALQDIVMQLLEKDVARRPATAADVARGLRAASHAQPPDGAASTSPTSTFETVLVGALSYPPQDAECEPVATAVTNAIAASISGVPGVRVQLSGPGQATLVVDGAVRRSGQRLRVSMRVVSADGTLRWSEQADGTIDDLFALEDSVAARVTAWFERTVTQPAVAVARAPRAAPKLSEADELVAKGVKAFNQFGPSGGAASLGYMQEARAYLSRALELEPRNARALCAMGNLVSVEGNHGLTPRDEALALGRRLVYEALAADDASAEVHTSLAKIALYNDDDLHQATRHCRRAVDINPTDPETLRFWCIICKTNGRLDDAVEAARQAITYAPDVAPFWNTLGDVLLAAGRNSEAIDALRRAIALLPRYGLALERLERARRAHGEIELAVELRVSRLIIAGHKERAQLLESDAVAEGPGAALRNDIRRELDELLASAAEKDPFYDYFARNVGDRIAAGYAELGDWTAAMDWVLKGFESRPGRLRRMLVDMPVDFRGLAVDPRYTRLMRVAGLEELI
jgi:serine/threonine-protein kinase